MNLQNYTVLKMKVLTYIISEDGHNKTFGLWVCIKFKILILD